MHIYKKAYPLLTVIGALLLLVNIVFLLCRTNVIFYFILAFCNIILYFFIIAFFRVPERVIIPVEKLAYSPAEGKVVDIEEVFEDEFLNAKCKKISVFMSVFNVHQNRIPVSGRVVYSKHHPGKYLVAWHPKSSSKNEHTTVVIETTKDIKLMVRQIAGFVARRIICKLKEDDIVKQGDELGFIMFRSRVEVFLPHKSKIQVSLDKKVKGNRSVLAEI